MRPGLRARRAALLWAAVGLLGGPALAQAGGPPAGDPARGQRVYESKCGACHSPDVDRTGPHHAGVVGRRAGSLPGFEYSAALKASRIVWTAQTLDRWLTNPEAVVPGQEMGFQLGDAEQRADVIAYLATLKPLR